MIRYRPGSVLWLLRHELRLALRRSAKLNWRALAVIGIVLVGIFAFGGAPLAAALAHRHLTSSPTAALVFDFALGVFFSLMVSQALSMTVHAFYERGDLDLLLSSPLPPRRVLLVRCCGIALGAVGLYLLIVTPLLAPVVVRGQWRLLAIYPLLLCLGLAAAGAGLLLALVLFATLGPRRTRTVGHVLAAFAGAFIFLASQIPQFLPRHHALLLEWVSDALRRGWFAPDSPLAWPLRAAFGASGPLLGLAGLSGALFLGVVEVAAARFPALASAAAGAHARRARNRRTRAFRTGLRSVLIRKELRLIARDPWLLSRVLLPVLFFIPALLLGFGHGGPAHMRAAIGAGMLTVIAGQVATNLAWITICAEDAPDLLRCAPVAASLARRAKMIAAVIPLALLTVPIGVLAWLHPAEALAAALGVAASAFSSACIQLWYQTPMPRSAFRRRTQGGWLATLGAMLVSIGWGAVAAIASQATPATLAIALAVALVPAMLLLLLWFGRNRQARPLYSRQLTGEFP